MNRWKIELSRNCYQIERCCELKFFQLSLQEKALAVSEAALPEVWYECDRHEYPQSHEWNHQEQDLSNKKMKMRYKMSNYNQINEIAKNKIYLKKNDQEP